MKRFLSIQTKYRQIRSSRQQSFIIKVLIVAAIFVVCFTSRLVPVPKSDRAIFTSIAEYLLLGNRLYVDIYDNKDPLFFYAVSIQRFFGPIAEYLFELSTVAISAVSAYDISCAVESTGKDRKKILLIAVPLVVTGIFWIPGYTTLPGVALSLLACALFVRHKALLAGGCIGLLAFTKLIMLPLPTVFCLVYELMLWDKLVSRKRLSRGTIGFIGVCGVVCGILFVRQELVGYLLAQQNNFFYANGVLIDNSSFVNAFVSHLWTVFIGTPEKQMLLASLIVSMSFAVYMVARASLTKASKALLTSSVAASIISILILGLTGLWHHHLSLTYASQTLILTGIAVSLSEKQRLRKILPNSLFSVVIVVCAIFLSGTLSWRHYVETPTRLPERIAHLAQASPEDIALTAIHPTGTVFARLGKNTQIIPYEAPNSRLLCPEFSQYYFYSPERLETILNCVKTAPTIVVDSAFAQLDEAPKWWPEDAQKQFILRDWNNFVTAGEAMLQSQYTCKSFEKVRICDSIAN